VKTNENGLTFRQWADAAGDSTRGTGDGSSAPELAWRNGEDPSDHRAERTPLKVQARPSAKPSRELARGADRTRLAAELQEQETKRDARTQEIADLEKTIASSKKQIIDAKKHEKSHASKAKALKAKVRKLL
jgi:hypothetical protein